MKITDYRTHTVHTPWRNLTYLVLETDAGIRGDPPDVPGRLFRR